MHFAIFCSATLGKKQGFLMDLYTFAWILWTCLILLELGQGLVLFWLIK
jgi:hypothetical protein